jgi:hypothetical protein
MWSPPDLVRLNAAAAANRKPLQHAVLTGNEVITKSGSPEPGSCVGRYGMPRRHRGTILGFSG